MRRCGEQENKNTTAHKVARRFREEIAGTQRAVHLQAVWDQR